VPKLAIFKGDTLEREVVLDGRDLRIGRSEQNEVVLSDPSKAVSRIHAELRYENGRYVLSDLNSGNGIWVGRRRQARIVLDPADPVTIGPYTLALRDTSPIAETYIGSSSADAVPVWDATFIGAGNQPWSGVTPTLSPRRWWSNPTLLAAFALFTALIVIAAVILRRGDQSRETTITSEVAEAETAPPLEPQQRDASDYRETATSGRGKTGEGNVPQNESQTASIPPKPSEPSETKPIERRRKETSLGRSPDDVLSQSGQKATSNTSPASASDDPWSTQYGAARSTVERGSLQEALKLFCAIDLSYRDVRDYIQRIGEAIHAQVKRVLQEAEKFEQAGDTDRALKQYELAATWNSSLRSCPRAPQNDWQTASTIVLSLRRLREGTNTR
jgi:FHA domain